MKNRTFSFGEGLFETFRVYKGRRVAFVEDHLDRMAEGCKFFSLPFSRNEALDELQAGLKKIPHDAEARLRLNCISYGDGFSEKTLFETVWEALGTSSDHQGRGVTLGLAPFQRFSRSPLVRFKTMSYLENISVLAWARREGLFDALFTNEKGEITEGSITNVFFVREGHVVTPPAEAGLLPGITRKQIIEVARTMDLPLTEAGLTPEDLDRFDAAFVTNSVVEVLPVSAVGSCRYENDEIVQRVKKGYKRHLGTYLSSII
jgi:branched-subunit amino acid aminotransferase/4-amino-4-deoxychorismate lyase